MVLVTAADRRSPRDPLTFPVRWEAPDPAPSPLNGIPADLYNIYARTELCRDCGKVPALRSLYPMEFQRHLTTCLLVCWDCGHNFFKPKSALGLADSASRSLHHNAQDAIRFYKG